LIEPWGGSLEVESRTTTLAEEAWREISEIKAAGGMVAAISKGIPQSRIESASAARQARIDSGAEKIVGVNFLRSNQPERIETREIDNRAVREAQIERLIEVKALRDEARVLASLTALEDAARNGVTNLLEAAIDTARARATVGEISDALERVFGRHNAVVKITTGVYGGAMTDESELSTVRNRTAHFQQAHGRRPRILVAKMGQDGHDRGAKIVACALADFGFDVDLAPLFGTPEEVCRQALDNDVHLIGISTLAGGHKTLVPDLIRCLREAGATHVRVSVGGIIPDGDHDFLNKAGVVAIFGPGTRLPDCAHALLNCLESP
jgi:methylmalonyl-CoA mutase